jgi:hypothetical protein
LRGLLSHGAYLPVRVAALAVLVAVGMAVYGAGVHFTGIASLSAIKRELANKRGGKDEANAPAGADME